MKYSLNSFSLLEVDLADRPSDTAASQQSLTARLMIELHLQPDAAEKAMESQPHFPFFTNRTTRAERLDIEKHIASHCTAPGATCTGLVRYLRLCHRLGKITDVFASRKELLAVLKAFGFRWSGDTLKNAIAIAKKE